MARSAARVKIINDEATASSSARRERLGSSVAERAEARREALLDAGFDLFGTIGFGRSTIQEICRHAKVSTRDFYESFEGREDVLLTLAPRLQATVFNAFAQGIESSRKRTPEGTLIDGICAVGRTMAEDPRIARIVYVETVGISAEHEQARRAGIRLFARGIADILDSMPGGAMSDRVHIDAIALAIVGAANELIADWAMTKKRSSPDELVAILGDTLATLLKGSQSKR